MSDILAQAEAIAAHANRRADDNIIHRYIAAWDCGDFDTMSAILDAASPELAEIICDVEEELAKDEVITPEQSARVQRFVREELSKRGYEGEDRC